MAAQREGSALARLGENERDLLKAGYIIAHARCHRAGVVRIADAPPYIFLPWWAIGDYRESLLGEVVASEIRQGYGPAFLADLLTTVPATAPATENVPQGFTSPAVAPDRQ